MRANLLCAVTAARNHAPVAALEVDCSLGVAANPIVAFMHQTMMPAAEQQRVGQARFAPRDPVPDVVPLHEPLVSATRKRAPSIPRPQRAPQRPRHHAPSASDAQRRSLLVFDDYSDAPVTSQTPHRLDRQIRATRLPAQRRLVHVHHDLVLIRRGNLARRAARQKRACDSHPRVGLLALPSGIGKLRPSRHLACRHRPVKCLDHGLARFDRHFQRKGHRAPHGVATHCERATLPRAQGLVPRFGLDVANLPAALLHL